MNRTSQEKNARECARSEMVLGRCLIEGDAEVTSRARRTRGKTFGASLGLEILLLGLLLAAPLLSSVAQPKISRPTFVPFLLGTTHVKHAPTQPEAPTREPSNYHDNPIAYVTGLTPHLPARPPENAGNASDPSPDVFGGDSGIEAPASFVGLRPSPPAAPPENIKNHNEKRPLKVSEPIIAAQLLSRIEPSYPTLARQLRQSGDVVLHAVIGRDGRISALEVVSGSPYFVRAALDAVRQWRYRPTLLDGEPVEVETTITVMFRLQP